MAQTTTTTLIGVYDDAQTARQVADELMSNGFRREDVQILSNDDLRSDVASGGAGLTGRAPASRHSGGITGWLENLFGSDVDEDERGHYAEAVRRGGTVVSVQTTGGDIDRATEILNRYNPIDIDQRVATWRESGYTGYDETARPLTTDEMTRERETIQTRRGDRAIPVVQEELQVGKRAIQRGGVRVYNRMTEQPVEQQVNLREEHVRVERRPVDRPATEADLRPAEEVIEVTETTEEPVIAKRARVVEEVVVGKEATERTQTVRDTVHRTDVKVEKMQGTTADVDYDTDFRRDFETRYASSGATYDTYAPAYRYGYQMASDSRYRGKSWNDVEETLRTDYMRNNPNSAWDRAKGAVRYGWEKVTGKR